MDEIAQLAQQALDDVAASEELTHLEAVRVRWLGKKGRITEQAKTLGKLPAAARPAAGARINATKQELEAAIAARQDLLERRNVARELTAGSIKAGRVDGNVPGDKQAAAERNRCPEMQLEIAGDALEPGQRAVVGGVRSVRDK